MIVKQREKPDYVEKVEVLLGRVPEQHPALLEIRPELSHAGLQGELNVGFYVKESLQLDTKVVHDLRLRADTGSLFEMDTFVATKQFALIFETKNYSIDPPDEKISNLLLYPSEIPAKINYISIYNPTNFPDWVLCSRKNTSRCIQM
ncbi:nuclease-related domain-containing protein [Bacillus sp. 37MA]|nr:nuclease-related domain-containing protein [Bacillus sp. 37MA]